MLKHRQTFGLNYDVALQSAAEYTKCWWVRSDGCGVVCSWITIALHLFALNTQMRFVIRPWQGSWINTWSLAYIFVCAMACLSHARCQFTQPGVVPKSLQAPPELSQLQQNKRYSRRMRPCKHCQIIKPKEAHHCSTCGRCIIRMDHHCPWVNNCVGALNQKYFLLFLFYTFLCSVFCLGLLVHRFWNCSVASKRRRHGHPPPTYTAPEWCHNDEPENLFKVLSLAFNFIEGIMFGLFTLIMGCDQVSHIIAGSSTINRMQGKSPDKKNAHEGLSLVFGEPISLRWFYPGAITQKLIKDFESSCLAFGLEDIT